MNIPSKQALIDACLMQVEKRILEINKGIDDAQYALTEETKSSAGDKYETSREMIQQDLNRYQTQMKNAMLDKSTLLGIDPALNYPIAGLGSIIVANNVIYFLAISIGAIRVTDTNVYVISTRSPIGAALLGKRVNEEIAFNQNQLLISVIA